MQTESVSSPRDEIKKARRQMIRSAFLALAALIVIIIACVAWFTNNTRVTSSVGDIMASGSYFELASVGYEGAYDNRTPEEFYENGTEWSRTDQEGKTESGTRTELNTVVQWRLTEKSNIGNNKATGIQPGSYGTLQFYVIPKTDGELKLKFHIDMLPLKEESDNSIVKYDGDNLNILSKLLKGHIMFFYATAEGNATWIPCDTGEFEMTFQGTEPQLVTLKWKWPYLWKDIDSDIQTKMKENDRAYIFSPEDDSSQDENLLYNNADMFIGENVTWLLVQLSAQMA